MKKTIILLAGYPGTGKTYLANLILERFPEFQFLSPDEIKEKNWDHYGFDSLDEKESLIQLSWKEYYQSMEQAFQHGKSLISDYPFSNKQKGIIEKLAKQYSVQVITIRLIGNLDVLFERQKTRDLDNSRHLGHILTSFHKDATRIEHGQADNLLRYEEFIRRCKNRGYGEFSLGDLIELDVSDFAKVDYEKLIMNLQKKIL